MCWCVQWFNSPPWLLFTRVNTTVQRHRERMDGEGEQNEYTNFENGT